CRRRAAGAGARLPAPARDSRQVLLEEREVAARDRALEHRPARLLGALRLPQRRRPLARRALRVLIPRTRDRRRQAGVDIWATTLPHPLEEPLLGAALLVSGDKKRAAFAGRPLVL